MKRYIAEKNKNIQDLPEDKISFVPKNDSHYRVYEVAKDKIQNKVWGEERWCGYEPYYTVKIMTLYPGFEVSLHSHLEKKETFYLLEGNLIVETINTLTGNTTKIELTEKFDNITIESNVPHTFYCPDGQKENTVFLEVSTEDSFNDNIRFRPSGKR